MKKSIIKNVIALTFALGALVFVAGNVFAGGSGVIVDFISDCPGGTKYVHSTGSKSERDGCNLVFYRAAGHWIYCPSTGEVIEDNSQWLWVFTVHGYYC